MPRKHISSKLRNSVLERDHYRCRYCGTYEPPFHLDHVYPVTRGGETSKENLVTACAKCNFKKHAAVKWPAPLEYFDVVYPTRNLTILSVKLLLSNLLGWGGISISIAGLYGLSFGGSDPLWKLGLYLLSIGPSMAYFGFLAMCSSKDAMINYYKNLSH
jgi:hypothetical protein